MSVVQILVDSREPEWCRNLKFDGAPVEVATLDAGDVWAMLDDGALIAIERKTSSDFLNTLRDGRLIPQVAKLRDLTEWAYVAICGTLTAAPGGFTYCDGRRTEWHWKSITGAQLDIQDLGVRVLHVAGDFDFEAEVVRLANRARRAIRFAPPRIAAPMGPAEAMLCSLPGVGPDRARTLLDHCHTGANALAFLVDLDADLAKVPGIGEETRRRVRRALGFGEHESYTLIKSFAWWEEFNRQADQTENVA